MYNWWLVKFVGVFFCGMLTKPCRHDRTFKLVSQQSWASINNKNSKILTKRLAVATTVPSGTQRQSGGIGIPGIPSDLRSRPELSHHLPAALLSRWLQEVHRVFNGRRNRQLYRKDAYIHHFYDCVLWMRPKKLTFINKLEWLIYSILPFVCIFDGFLHFCGCFLWIDYQTLSPCRNFSTGQPPKHGKY